MNLLLIFTILYISTYKWTFICKNKQKSIYLMNNEYIIYRHTHLFSQKYKNTKMQRSERRTPSWLGGMPSDAAFRWWNIKCKIPESFEGRATKTEQESAVIPSYLRNQRAIGPFITHCHQQKIFTPLQAHGMENFTAWRGRIFSLWMPFTNPIPHKSKWI